MDIRRRNTRKYSFRCSNLMELRKVASFVDDPKGFRDRFGRLLFVLSTDVEDSILCTLVQFYDPIYQCFTFPDYQLLPTMEEYAHLLGVPVSDRVPFNGVEGILESRVIAEVIHLRKSNIEANLTVKGGIRRLTSKFLLEKSFSFANTGSMMAFETILSLLVYGLVLFLNIDNFVDVNAMRIFLVKNMIPNLLGDTYFSIYHRTYKGGGTIVCCAPLLYKWFISHLPQSPVFQENKNCLRWSQRLMSLTNDDITWYSPIYDDVDIIDRKDTQGLKVRIMYAWHNVHKKEKSELGLKNCVALKPYTSRVKKIVKEFKVSYAYERPMSLVMVKSPNIKGIKELQEALDMMKLEKDEWEKNSHLTP
ncbi:uncharacterized protein LOC127136047 [Lathyrus oleraceus]|uniref:uncharacterized protein LOC127136047 n=1 Tax=Pisum sativum TaxID=3888 RepID=UPI0021CF9725|nr:uncharacterized protein LOC127136047 [Pisum sativum]